VIIFVEFLTMQKYDIFTRSLRGMHAFFQISNNRCRYLLARPFLSIQKHKKTDCGLLRSGFVGWGIDFVGWGVGFAFRSFPIV
jgi:hypothetical protein